MGSLRSLATSLEEPEQPLVLLAAWPQGAFSLSQRPHEG